VQLTRLEAVINGMLAKMPTATAFGQALQSLGSAAQSTMTVTRVGSLVSGLAVDAQAQNVDYRTLDVSRIDTGGPTIYSLDRAKVRAFVQQSLAASIPAGLLSGGNTVLVKNGVGTPQLGRTTRVKLINAGFVYVEGGNVPGFPFRAQRSHVLVGSPSQASIARGDQVAKALGLPSTDVDLSSRGQSVADIIVLLGKDYRG
jgi:hypothetical protein